MKKQNNVSLAAVYTCSLENSKINKFTKIYKLKLNIII